MTRVIAGSAGGRRLRVPDGDRVRPTSDRVKEAMFSSLGVLSGTVVLDLFAGTGGLGIEALSRGAAQAVFVESDRRTVAVLRDNIQAAGIGDRARVVASSASSFSRLPSGGPFDLVLLDPPYDRPMHALARDVSRLIDAAAIRPNARIVMERDRHTDEAAPDLLTHDQDRTYGETVLRYFTFTGRDVPTPATTTDEVPQ